MRLIGLCGRSGSGKSGFCEIARELGYKVIDCDKVYAELVSHPSECLLEIEAHFGEESVIDGRLNRKAVAKIVFSDRKKLELLNAITHKYITERVFEIINACGENELIILDAPALFESGLDKKCDSIIGIIAPEEDCVERIIKRDSITAEQAGSRLSNQRTNDFIIENSDYIVYNETTQEAFAEASCALLTAIKEEMTA